MGRAEGLLLFCFVGRKGKYVCYAKLALAFASGLICPN